MSLHFKKFFRTVVPFWCPCAKKMKFTLVLTTTLFAAYLVFFQISAQALDEEYAKYIYFHFYKNYRSYDVIPYLDSLFDIKNAPQFHVNWKTIFYFPGWSENPSNTSLESVNVISDAFMKKGEVNFIVLNYYMLVKGDEMLQYVHAFTNTSTIGRLLGNFLSNYTPKIQTIDQIHLIGHSMGAQIMSYTAKNFGAGILRLSALDPAGPLFTLPGVPHLNSLDGSFVDVIHTDSNRYGDFRSVGTVDFFPNHGIRIQPYCKNSTNDFCSHHMSWVYYAESVNSEKHFPARKCLKRRPCVLVTAFGVCQCEQYGNEVAYMGYGVGARSSGDFYLTTGSSSPYGKSILGLNMLFNKILK